MSEKEKKIVSCASIVVTIVLFVVLTVVVGRPLIALAKDPDAFQDWLNSIGPLGKLAFVAIVVTQVLIAFIPGEPIELAAGYIFGFWEGTVLTMIGFVIGSWIVFVLVRKFGIKLVEVFFSKEQLQQIGFLKNPKKSKALTWILMTIPGTPKDMLSYFAGLMQINTLQWLTIVVVGRLPSLITSTLTGAAAGEENYILSAVCLCITLLISAIGIVYYRHICKTEKA